MIAPGLFSIVLCGGQSKRMGRPKAWLPFGGEPLLCRIVRRLGNLTSGVVVVAAPGQDLPPLPEDVAIVHDSISGRGPLQGIAAGFEAFPSKAQAAYVSSTDAPFLEPAFVRRLHALRGDQYDIVVPRVGGHFHPLSAIYGRAVRPFVDELLAADRLRPFFLFERVRTLVADEDLLLDDPDLRAADPLLRSLRNLNTPGDYAEALREAGFAKQ